MKISIKKNNLSRVALLATLITMTNGYIDAAENEIAMQDFGAFFYHVEQTLANFFDQKNKTAFIAYITKLETLFNDFKRKIEEAVTRNNSDTLTKEINDLIDYTIYKFNIAYNIMKKYCNRSDSEFLIFGTEIERDFNPEKVFGDIIVKLKALKCKAEKAKEKDLVEKIATIVKMVEAKGKQWNAKSRMTLLEGIRCRMKCK
jgi:hypothetical protein